MLEEQAQSVLLVRAFEEADPDGIVVPRRTREEATRRALRVVGLGDFEGELLDTAHVRSGEVLHRRARHLLEGLQHRVPALKGALYAGKLGSSTLPLALAVSFVAGLSTHVLGGRRVDLLAAPVFGVLLWNAVLYAVLGFGALTGRRAAGARLTDRLLRGAIWRRVQKFKYLDHGGADSRKVTGRALLRYAGLWHRCAGDLLTARVRRMLHAAAAVLACGVIVGMYARGLVLEYRAAWESTWLEAATVQTVLDLVLAPASLLTGISVPSVPAKGAAVEAAPWIHLFAGTLGLFVVLPRTVAATWWALRCYGLKRRVDVDVSDPYFVRLFRDWRGATTCVDVVPYSYTPTAETSARLLRSLRDLWGGRADVRVRAAVAYGEEPTELVGGPAGPWRPRSPDEADVSFGGDDRIRVLVFNLAQTPEAEVHGRLLERVRDRVAETGGRVAVLLDDHDLEASRVPARVEAWREVARDVGLPVGVLSHDGERDERLRTLESSLWPAA